MKLRNIDLNLLVILDALLVEQNVTKAAEKVGMSQSAVSHALRRLRSLLGDPLLVRNGKQMELTWRANYIRDPLRSTLSHLEFSLSEDIRFDPATSSRTFTLRVSRYVSDYLLARVCEILRRLAPGLRLQVEQFREGQEHSLVGDEIQVRLPSRITAAPNLRFARLIEDDFVVLMSKSNPAATKQMTLNLYLQLSHARISTTSTSGEMIDEALTKRGLSRRIIVQLPSWVDLAPIVESTDLVATIPRHWATAPYLRRGCVSKPLPVDDVRFAVDVVWDGRFDEDPGHKWLRAIVFDVLRSHSNSLTSPQKQRSTQKMSARRLAATSRRAVANRPFSKK